MKEKKKHKQKIQIRVSRHEYMCIYIGLRTQDSCTHTHTSSLCTYVGKEVYARRHALNPNPVKQKHIAKLKTNKSNNPTSF